MNQTKESVKLRKRKRPSGNTALFLEFYIKGKRSYEYLNLFLIPEKTRADKERNKETLRLAETIRGERLVEVQNGRFGFEAGYKLDTNFLDYYRMLCEKRHQNPESLGNWGNWYSALKHLERYCRPDMTFRNVTPAFVQGFKEYLDKTARVRDKRKKTKTSEDTKPISNATKVSYFNKLRACINQAFEDGIIPRNPLRGIDGFKLEERERVYLTLDEVRAMATAECKYPVLRNAFLFSCLTGLRKSDIEKMTWKEVRQQGEFTRIVFRQKKTGGQEYIDINPQARSFMGARRNPEDHVFPNFSYSSYYLMELKRWAVRAGVTKDITFHSGRHYELSLSLNLNSSQRFVS